MGGEGRAADWMSKGWDLLEEQFPMQVPDDGVCREASIPYHRLVAELFLLPALAREANGLPVSIDYWNRLRSMSNFIAAYMLKDTEPPIWGDADDGRALPLGTQELNDHSYLIETLRTQCKPLKNPKYDETIWWLGIGDAEPALEPKAFSTSFDHAGAFIMRTDEDRIFVDAGPVGMAGRGGHGHNDCLSVDVTLKGARLIVDPGAYVYTSDSRARNAFRSTSSHNTPI